MAARPPPLLLTKRLTSFLHLNLSAQITTLLLLTPDGKLLAYASNPPIPVATLRTHATVAASLYAIHGSGTDRDTIDGALGPNHTTTPTASASAGGGGGSSSSSSNRRGERRTPGGGRDGPLAVTIQLESGVVLVIRRLRCGMLFVCMGPPEDSPSRPQTQSHQQHQQQPQPPTPQQQHTQPLAGAIQTTTSASAAAREATNGHAHPPASTTPPPTSRAGASAAHLGSPSEAASILSGATGATTQTTASSIMFGAGTAGVMATRRHAEELARWLDERLGALEVPTDGLGGVM